MKALIVGCGKQGEKHLSGYRANGINDIAVTDVNPEALDGFAAKTQVAALAYSEAFDCGATMASICTPTSTHAETIGKCIDRGIHFLCEKPLATDYQQAASLHEMAEAAKTVGMVGYTYRYAQSFELAKKVLGTGQEGQPGHCLGNLTNAIFRIGGRGNHAVWKHLKSSDGGAINEMLVHMLDLAHWLLGPLHEVELIDSQLTLAERVVGGKAVGCDAEDWVVLKCRTGCAVPVLIQADFTTPSFSQYVEINGSNGSFWGSITNNHNTTLTLLEAAEGYQKGINQFSFTPENLYKKIIESFLVAQQTGGKINKSPLQDSLRLMQWLEALQPS